MARLQAGSPRFADAVHPAPTERDEAGAFVQLSRLGKTITIDDAAYKLLCGLKRGRNDSFTKVILRHVNRPADTCGALLDEMDKAPLRSSTSTCSTGLKKSAGGARAGADDSRHHVPHSFGARV